MLFLLINEEKKKIVFYNNLGIHALIIYFALCLSIYI